jgi:hypothetical protein
MPPKSQAKNECEFAPLLPIPLHNNIYPQSLNTLAELLPESAVRGGVVNPQGSNRLRQARCGKSHTADQPLVTIVVPNPEPVEGIVFKNRQSAIAASDSDGPRVSNLFEPERWVTRLSQP